MSRKSSNASNVTRGMCNSCRFRLLDNAATCGGFSICCSTFNETCSTHKFKTKPMISKTLLSYKLDRENINIQMELEVYIYGK